jgi:hypothetical protein
VREYESQLAAAERSGKLSDYQQGYIAGLRAFAWMRDGVLYVGTTGTTLAKAIENRLRQLGLWAASSTTEDTK